MTIVRMIIRTLRVIVNMRIFFSDSLSVPKTIGIGPIIITPAPLVFAFRVPDRRIISAVITMMIIPVTARKKPTL